jgi:type I site-specific restriction endonuclease
LGGRRSLPLAWASFRRLSKADLAVPLSNHQGCHIDLDVEGYRPEKGTVDRDGEEVEDRIYNAKGFDRALVLISAPSC